MGRPKLNLQYESAPKRMKPTNKENKTKLKHSLHLELSESNIESHVHKLPMSIEQTGNRQRTLAAFASDHTHVNELPPELLINIFNYLPLQDLSSIRQISKRWRQLSGSCFELNHSSMMACYRHYRYDQVKRAIHFKVNPFVAFFRRITIFQIDELQQFVKEQRDFEHLKMIRLSSVDLTGIQMDDVKQVFNSIEHIEIFKCDMDKDFANCVVTWAPKLKRLVLYQTEIGNEWLNRKYHTLDSCAFVPRTLSQPIATNNMAIATFLENNPNVREFGVSSHVLWENWQSMRTMEVKLDVLNVHVDESVKSSVIRRLLNELYDLGVFKGLHLCRNFYNKHIMDNDLAALKGLKQLHMYYGNTVDTDFDNLDQISPLDLKNMKSVQGLEHLGLANTLHIKDIEAALANLQHLQRFHTTDANFSHIVLFVEKLPNLREIAVESFDNAELMSKRSVWVYSDHFDYMKNAEHEPEFVDMCMLNRERTKLRGAVKVTLYVEERLYSATKWAMKGTVDFDFIRLKCMKTFEVNYGLFSQSIMQCM